VRNSFHLGSEFIPFPHSRVHHQRSNKLPGKKGVVVIVSILCWGECVYLYSARKYKPGQTLLSIYMEEEKGNPSFPTAYLSVAI
jgi:hypothetical protein